jgi:MarR family 2-MHQ and catechol resistance regulon transcriptional repressor
MDRPPTTLPSRLKVALSPEDPLAHRALESMFRAEAALRRALFAELQREGLSASGFSVLVVLVSAGGELELRAVRQRLRTSKANVAEVISTLQARGLVSRRRLSSDRRAASIVLSDSGRAVVERLFPEHTGRVREVFSVLDEEEKRSLMSICRKLAA